MIRVVTDSTALFVDPMLVKQYHIEVVPVYVRFGEQRFRLGFDLDAEEFLYRMQRHDSPPVLEPPSIDEFYNIYARLNRETTQIISLHISDVLTDVCKHALAASKMLLGRCDIAVIDSQTLSAGLGMLVEHAAYLSMQTHDLEIAVREVRRAIPRLYAVFYVQSMKTICRYELITESQAILGTMLGIMPCVTIEEGQLTIMEKALNHHQAIDKLVEFATEFTQIEQLVILHHSTSLSEPVRQLQDRLALELGSSNFPTQVYDGSVATFLGPDATGIVIFESENDED